jgi:branched-chain amino acid transport system permease protein
MALPSTISANRRIDRLLSALAALLAVALFASAYLKGGHLIMVLGFACIYAVYVSGLNVFMGFAGQVSFGQNAFAAIGGYTSAITTTVFALPVATGICLGLGISIVVAVLVGVPTLRLRGHYLAMGTMALGLITYEISIEWTSVTQGYAGIAGIPPLGIGSFELISEKAQLWVLVIIAVTALLIAWALKNSRFGRALQAVAGSEQAAQSLGVDLARYKLASFAIAAMFASVSGSLFAHFVGFISPEMFGVQMVMLGFTMLYLGGIDTILGPAVGALIVLLLPELFRGFKEFQDIIFSVVLVLILIFAPKGLASLLSARSGEIAR